MRPTLLSSVCTFMAPTRREHEHTATSSGGALSVLRGVCAAGHSTLATVPGCSTMVAHGPTRLRCAAAPSPTVGRTTTATVSKSASTLAAVASLEPPSTSAMSGATRTTPCPAPTRTRRSRAPASTFTSRPLSSASESTTPPPGGTPSNGAACRRAAGRRQCAGPPAPTTCVVKLRMPSPVATGPVLPRLLQQRAVLSSVGWFVAAATTSPECPRADGLSRSPALASAPSRIV
mmetsp:Transcript_21972/g.51511  ORF Transcript_21972/g.51511 Transcript_21972/m.51511 type:complete len:233 (-) Transcript_21972:544-1242(-)